MTRGGITLTKFSPNKSNNAITLQRYKCPQGKRKGGQRPGHDGKNCPFEDFLFRPTGPLFSWNHRIPFCARLKRAPAMPVFLGSGDNLQVGNGGRIGFSQQVELVLLVRQGISA